MKTEAFNSVEISARFPISQLISENSICVSAGSSMSSLVCDVCVSVCDVCVCVNVCVGAGAGDGGIETVQTGR